MVKIYSFLFTYQTIGKEIVKEQSFQKRIEHYRNGEESAYQQVIDEEE